MANPPYGKSWKGDLERMGVKDGINDPRFVIEHAGDTEYTLLTRSSDGQMMFLANMLSKMKQGTKLGSRIAEPQPLRSLEDIRADILALEQETEGLLSEIIGVGNDPGTSTSSLQYGTST